MFTGLTKRFKYYQDKERLKITSVEFDVLGNLN